MKSKKKFSPKNLIWKLIFLIGALILAYPIISRFYYRIESNDQVEVFNEGKSKLDEEEIKRRIGLAKAYNDSLAGVVPEDPFAQKKQEEGKKEYARMLEVEEMIGHVEIPKINQDLPVYAGTSEEVLQKGAGHLEGTSLPIGGDSTHTVITAHRGLPNALLFRNLNQMTEGDIFYIHNIKETLAYKVDKIQVIEPWDFDPILVTENKDYATLLTCTPYMINSHRLLIRGYRIDYTQAIDDGQANTPRLKPNFFQLFLILMPILLFVILAYIREKKRYKIILREVGEIEKKLKEK